LCTSVCIIWFVVGLFITEFVCMVEIVCGK